MRFLRLFGRNGRWVRQVDAHVDGRLTPVERALLDERLGESESLTRTFAETRELKRILRAIPEHPAPRSFAITGAMLAESTPARPPRAARAAMRLSQGTAFAAVAAFGVLVAFDLTGAGGNAVSPASTGEDAISMASTEAGGGDDSSKLQDGGDQAPAAADQQSPEEVTPNLYGDSVTEALPPGAGGSVEDTARNGAGDNALLLAETDSERDYLPLYAAAGGVLMLAVAGWLLSRHQLSHVSARV